MTSPEAPAPRRPRRMWTALRRDPGHAPELALLYTLPQLTPGVTRWRSRRAAGPAVDQPAQMARRVLRHSTHIARRASAITGSSFYVGMAPAMAMIYCEQLIVVLRIAALYGRDPGHPARAGDPGHPRPPPQHRRRGRGPPTGRNQIHQRPAVSREQPARPRRYGKSPP